MITESHLTHTNNLSAISKKQQNISSFTNKVLISTIVGGLILLSVNQASAFLESQTPLELYNNHELIVIGKVISLTEKSNLETLYNVKVEEYIKNPKPYDLIDAYGTAAKNGGIWIEDQTVFEIGDRVLLYLYKEDEKYKISPYSFIAPKSCEKRQLLELLMIPGEPRSISTPVNDPIHLTNSFGNETDTFVVNEEINIDYYLVNNNPRSDQVVPTITIMTDSANVFRAKQSVPLEPCTQTTISYQFTPERTGEYTVNVTSRDISASTDFQVILNKAGGSIDKGTFQSPLKQFESRGVSIEEVICKPDLVLIGKYKDATPACVKPETATILIKSGWGRLVIRSDYDTTRKNCGTNYHLVYPFDSAEKFSTFHLDYLKFHFSQLDNFKEKFGPNWWDGIRIKDTIWKRVFLIDFPIILMNENDERHYIDELLYREYRYSPDENTQLRPQYFGIYCNQ